MKKVLLLLHFSLFVFLVNAQDPNKPYQLFSNAYENLDAKLLSSSYTGDAFLINVYNQLESESFHSREVIAQFFTSLFDQAAKEEKQLKIIFKISDRKEVDNSILDNGYYHLVISEPNKSTDHKYGKFSIVLRKESGEWKFFIDTNASATREEFEEGVTITDH